MKKVVRLLAMSLVCLLVTQYCLAQEQTDTTSTERSEPGEGEHTSGSTYYPDGTVYFSNASNDYAENMGPQVLDGLTRKVIDCDKNEADCKSVLERASGYSLRNPGAGTIPPPRLSRISFNNKKMTASEITLTYKAIKSEQESLQSSKKGVYTLQNGRWIYVKEPAILTRAIIASWKKKRNK